MHQITKNWLALVPLVIFISLAPCDAQRLTRFADPMIGTGGHGHTYPGATVPFAMVQLSPDNGDEGYISKLPVFSLPHLPKDRKFRSFPSEGDSMYPFPENAIIVGEYVDNWFSLKNDVPCIVVTKDEGIVFKLVLTRYKRRGRYSLNLLMNYISPMMSKLMRFVRYGNINVTLAIVSLLQLYLLRKWVNALRRYSLVYGTY